MTDTIQTEVETDESVENVAPVELTAVQMAVARRAAAKAEEEARQKKARRAKAEARRQREFEAQRAADAAAIEAAKAEMLSAYEGEAYIASAKQLEDLAVAYRDGEEAAKKKLAVMTQRGQHILIVPAQSELRRRVNGEMKIISLPLGVFFMDNKGILVVHEKAFWALAREIREAEKEAQKAA